MGPIVTHKDRKLDVNMKGHLRYFVIVMDDVSLMSGRKDVQTEAIHYILFKELVHAASGSNGETRQTEEFQGAAHGRRKKNLARFMSEQDTLSTAIFQINHRRVGCPQTDMLFKRGLSWLL